MAVTNMLKRSKLFHSSVKEAFNTEAGKQVLAILKEDYVNNTAVGDSAEVTYYKLGQKEFVQGLISIANNDVDIDRIISDHEDELDIQL